MASVEEATRRLEDGARGKEAPVLPPRRTGHGMSSSSLLRRRSDRSVLSKVRSEPLRRLLANLQEVFLGTKLSPLFPAVPLAIAAQCFDFGRAWVFALSMVGLAPLAERLSFLSEQISYYAGPTVGGLLNATCGNAPELIIALLALQNDKMEVLKWSLVGSILSNLLLVLGSSLFCGGIANYTKERPFDRKQSDVNLSLLLLGALCYIFALVLRQSASVGEGDAGEGAALSLSRSCSTVMLVAYFGCLFFQLKTHRQLFEPPEDEADSDDDTVSDTPVIGFASAFAWLVGMTAAVAVLSDSVVTTIEAASESWGMSVSFISVILLPVVGNAAEHAAAIIFAFKNKIDITLGITLGSSTQISMFVVPLSVIAAWIKGIHMDLDFELLETGSLVMSILITAFTLQDGTWHYMKGFVLLLCYVVIGASFFILGPSLDQANATNSGVKTIPTNSVKA
ncbi:vacuolar cation/proton exchanger 1a isoform X2 [Elaeis guineensis]|uniref:Vacuolar cation/proton exchanger n=1 Tax=Elaeis guineensis var. tenera TaxID=51953 RepID=A0A6I9R0L9_ELAGV|nr:vacuolar cation/proton exchanger 1a isoform X2 [Elaeis guineensis]